MSAVLCGAVSELVGEVSTVRRESAELEYAVAGDGPELVWLHGLGGNLEADNRLAARLSRSHKVLWYSSRFHGRSRAPTTRVECGYDRYADDLAAVLDAAGFARPLLAGGSHGANTILRHEQRHPGRARALLLIAPGGNSIRRVPMHHLAAVLWARRRAVRRGRILELAFGEQLADPQMAAAAASHDPDAVAFAMRYLVPQRAVDPAALTAFGVPTEVLAWAGDPVLHPLAIARRVAELVPGATFTEIDRRPDLSIDETADYAASVILDWSDRQETDHG